MARTTSGLFVVCTENVILVLILHQLLSGIMNVSVPLDFSPLMRGTMQAQLVLVLFTAAIILIVSARDRSQIIPAPPVQVQVAGDSAMKDDVASWISHRANTVRLAFSAAHAYSMVCMALFLLLVASISQAASGWMLDEAWEDRLNSDTGIIYRSSRRLDWVQAVAGVGTGWVLKENNIMMGDAYALPVAGSIFSGVVAAFLALSLVMSLFLALTAMAEGESSYLFLEPRGLIIANGVVAFSGPGSIYLHFSMCSWDVLGPSVLLGIFCLSVCWLDELVSLILWTRRDRMQNVGKYQVQEGSEYDMGPLEKLYRCAVLLTLGWMPVVRIAHIQNSWTPASTPMTIMMLCILMSAASSIMVVVDVLIFQGRQNRSSALQAGIAISSTQEHEYAVVSSTKDQNDPISNDTGKKDAGVTGGTRLFAAAPMHNPRRVLSSSSSRNKLSSPIAGGNSREVAGNSSRDSMFILPDSTHWNHENNQQKQQRVRMQGRVSSQQGQLLQNSNDAHLQSKWHIA